MKNKTFSEEAQVLANYLVASPPTLLHIELFIFAVKKYELNVLNSKESRLWILCLENPWLLPFIDGGLAIVNKNCIFRKRLYFFLNILEASPKNYNKFIFTRKTKISVLLRIFSLGFMGLLHSLIGVILVKILR